MNYSGCLLQLVMAVFKILSADSQLKARDHFFMSIMVVFVCIAPLLCIFTVSSPYNANTVSTQTRTITPLSENDQQQFSDAFIHTLTLDEVISDTFEEGQRVRLIYSDDTSVVATLQIVVEQGELPSVVQSTINSEGDIEFVSSTPDENNTFQLCGYELQAEHFYSFSFEVPITTFYNIKFKPGNTCNI